MGAQLTTAPTAAAAVAERARKAGMESVKLWDAGTCRLRVVVDAWLGLFKRPATRGPDMIDDTIGSPSWPRVGFWARVGFDAIDRFWTCVGGPPQQGGSPTHSPFTADPSRHSTASTVWPGEGVEPPSATLHSSVSTRPRMSGGRCSGRQEEGELFPVRTREAGKVQIKPAGLDEIKVLIRVVPLWAQHKDGVGNRGQGDRAASTDLKPRLRWIDLRVRNLRSTKFLTLLFRRRFQKMVRKTLPNGSQSLE